MTVKQPWFMQILVGEGDNIPNTNIIISQYALIVQSLGGNAPCDTLYV